MLTKRKALGRVTPENDHEPTPADLAAIEAEWPLIAAELDVVDAQVSVLLAGERVSELDWRRLRRAEARVLRVAAELTERPEPRRSA